MYVEPQWKKGFWKITGQSYGQHIFCFSWITRLHDYVHMKRQIILTESAEPILCLKYILILSSRLIPRSLGGLFALRFPTKILKKNLILIHTFYIFRWIIFSQLVNLLKLLISPRNAAWYNASCLSVIFSHHRMTHLNKWKQDLSRACLSTTLDAGKCSEPLSLKFPW
jgi:hypothetical protein